MKPRRCIYPGCKTILSHLNHDRNFCFMHQTLMELGSIMYSRKRFYLHSYHQGGHYGKRELSTEQLVTVGKKIKIDD